jgi:hypothetical protein
VQLAAIDALKVSGGRITVAELAAVLGLTERRCRTVVTALSDRGLVEITREKIGQQPNGRPVHGLVVWDGWTRFRRNADRWNADRYAKHQAETTAWLRTREAEQQVPRCHCCGQPLATASIRTVRGVDGLRRFIPGGPLSGKHEEAHHERHG